MNQLIGNKILGINLLLPPQRQWLLANCTVSLYS